MSKYAKLRGLNKKQKLGEAAGDQVPEEVLEIKRLARQFRSAHSAEHPDALIMRLDALANDEELPPPSESSKKGKKLMEPMARLAQYGDPMAATPVFRLHQAIGVILQLYGQFFCLSPEYFKTYCKDKLGNADLANTFTMMVEHQRMQNNGKESAQKMEELTEAIGNISKIFESS